MTTAEVAKELVALCQKGEFEKAMNSLYADNIVSVEAFDMNGMPRETRGIDGVRKKSEWWAANHTMHSATVTGPFTSVDKFAVNFAIDVTFKPTGKRHTMTEVAVYTVTNGKIVHEEFLYEAK
jgi:SnoaL-like domain